MIKYPSIEQYRNAIADIQKLTRSRLGKRDEHGELIEGQIKAWTFPTVEFSGSVKLHGTNAAVVIRDDTVEYQSRNRVLTTDYDNAGFAAWASQHEDQWKSIGKNLGGHIIIFGEWCGGSIQSNVALTGLPLMFVVFEAWHIDGLFIDIDSLRGHLPEQTFLVTQFPTWKMTIDIENPQFSQNDLVEITNAVEAECPVGKHFGVSGIGEGVVWSADVYGQRVRFKVKGREHSTHHVKVLAAVDVERVGTLNDFVANALTPSRLDQGLDYLREQGLPITLQSTGDFIRWIIGDVFKEDADIIAASGLNEVDVRKRIGSTAAIKYKTVAFAPEAIAA